MKIRLLAATLCTAVCASGILAPSGYAQTKPTMAEKYDPYFGQPYNPFGQFDNPVNFQEVGYSVPEGGSLSILNEKEALIDSNVYVFIRDDQNLWIQIFPEDASYEGEIATTRIKFLVNYPDGSSEVVDHTFVLHLYQRDSYIPSLEDSNIIAKKDAELKVSGIPSDAKLAIISKPNGWQVTIVGQTLQIHAPSTGLGEIVVKVSYSDGTTESVLFKISADPATEKIPSTPSDTDDEPTHEGAGEESIAGDGSSTGEIIGIVLGVLAIVGGIGAFIATQLPNLNLAGIFQQ